MFYCRTSKIGTFFVSALLAFWAVGFYFLFQNGFFKKSQSSQEPYRLPVELSYENVDILTQKTAIKEPLHIADSSLPVPTNQWFSSVAFSHASEPMFAYPLAVKMNSDGFGISYPKVVSTPDTVFASYTSDVQILFKEKNLDSSIRSYDDLSVDIIQQENKNLFTKLRITHGSPYVFASVSPKKSFELVAENPEVLERGENFLLFTTHGKLFAFFYSPGEMAINLQEGSGFAVSVFDVEAHFSLAVLPSRDSLDIFKQFAFDPIVGTKVDFGVVKGSVQTQYEIMTEQGGETLLALLPASVASLENRSLPSLGNYETLRGEQSLYLGKKFLFLKQSHPLPQRLDVSSLSEESTVKLREYVRTDANILTLTEEDTYFLGKKLFALANVLDLAEQLGMNDESSLLAAKLKKELGQWQSNTENRGQEKKYFYYDPVVKGIVGEQASFGSEFFNDHNFHYGYFIYAASILARYDHDYLKNSAQFINLLVKDIANTDRADTAFPYLRGFDAYEGHSWASGQGLFADGNNQESSSEAVNAWYALFLWGTVIGNEKLTETAQYLYEEESASALEYWMNIDRSDVRFQNFKHPFASLLWGGKLDAATWFSARPEARLAIQILPISPGSLYLGRDKKRVEENLAGEMNPEHPTMFRDYLAMYRAFFDPTAAREEIAVLNPEDIDSANSKSFMEAWLLTLQKQIR